MNVFRIPTMNRTRLTVVGILLLVGHPHKFAHGDGSTPETAVPLPCSESFLKFGTEYNSCNNLFGKCGLPGATPEPNDYISNLIDLLVRDLVLVEMQGLYKGVDTYTNGANPTPLRPAEFVGTNPTGRGTCATVGACNLFCGEGYAGSSDIKAVLDQVTNPKLGSQGYVPGLAKSAKSGTSLGNSKGEPERLLQGKIPKTFDPKSFPANGVVDQYYDSNSKAVVKVNEMSPPPALPGITGWPSFSFTITPQLAGEGNACAPIPDDQSSIAQTGFINSAAGELPINNSYLVDSVTWLDSTFANDGSGPCHAVSGADFTNASGVASLHTGVFVQALWMKLQEVIDGILANNYLNVTMPKCRSMASQYKTSLKDSMDAFFNLSSTNKCTVIPEGCGKSVLSKTATETVTNSNGVSTCVTDATILLLQSSSIKDIAVCEIYEGAQSLFNSNMNVPTTSPNSSESAMAWVDQIRNYAITSCMNRNPPFSNSIENCDPYCMVDPEAAAMASLLVLSFVPVVGIIPAITLLGLLAAGVEFVGPYDMATLNGKNYSDIQNEMKTRYSTNLADCFPYAYSLFFNSYLKTKLPVKMTTVPIQGLNTEGENSVWTSPSGKITISGCQMKENAPNPGN